MSLVAQGHWARAATEIPAPEDAIIVPAADAKAAATDGSTATTEKRTAATDGSTATTEKRTATTESPTSEVDVPAPEERGPARKGDVLTSSPGTASSSLSKNDVGSPEAAAKLDAAREADANADRPHSPFERAYPVGTRTSGYIQAQYEHSQLSEDQLTQSGGAYNLDRFAVARARIRFDYATRWSAAAMELEGTSSRGTVVAVRRAEVGLLHRRSERALPTMALHVGIFDIPFGYEVVNPHRARWFVERSTGSGALFPSTSDTGVKLSGAPAFVRYQLAFVNGQVIDDMTKGSLVDPNASKDFVGRIGADFALTESVEFASGVSFLEGRGFHAGSPATKNTSVWQDTNENGRIDTGEVVGLPARSASPSANFAHWALGLDFQLRARTRLGWLDCVIEGFVASNLDRALVVADPVLIGTDTRELGFYAAVTQQVTRFGILGFRYDYYDPNADFVVARAGRLLPATQTIHTFSPLVGASLPGRIRLVFQYDIVRDHFGRDVVGVPTDSRNDRFTLRAQGEL